MDFLDTEVPVSLYEGTVNESVTLSCVIYDATEVKWRHNDVQIATGNDKYCNGNTTVPSLTITNLTREDSGRYQCESAYDSIRSIGYEIILQIKEHKNEKLTSTITVLATVGSAAVLIILTSTTIVVAFIKRKRRTFRTNHDYAERDNTEVELHLYDETQATSDSKPSAHCYAYSYASSTLKSNQNESDMTSKTYNVRDLMHLLQDESLTKRIQMEFQLLNATPELTAALDYENVDVKSGAAIGKTCTNKSLIKKQDGDSGYIITTVPNQSDIDTFWTMIIDCHARYIVLLVQMKEKISRFFPSTDVTINTSKFKVELSSSEKYPNKVFAFNLAVWNKEKKTEVQVKLCKTTEWKVGEKHPSIDTLCTLLDVVSNQESVMAVFIGSKGIGFPVRGGLGACHEVFRAVKAEKDFSILQIVVDLKKKLPDLFQTFEEYNLCYKVIGHFLENEHAYDVID